MTTQTSRLVIEIDLRNALRNAQAISRELENIDKNGQFASKTMDSVSMATRQLCRTHGWAFNCWDGCSKNGCLHGYGEQVTDALAGMFGSMLGESSSAYRALYTAQQSFALAQAGMNVWKSASDAYANEPRTV